MKRRSIFLIFLIIYLPCHASQAVINPLQQKIDLTNKPSLLQDDLNSLVLMTAQDLAKNGSSNLNLTNHTGEALTVYGVYLYGVAFITPGLDCTNGIAGHSNATIQPFMSGLITPIQFTAGQSVPIGQNYLYNMIYTWIYFYTSLPSPLGCSLPGCTWTSDTPHNWCVQLGAISPDAPYTYTDNNSNVMPLGWPPTLIDPIVDIAYNYNLIPNNSPAYIWLGPFTCDDQTLTCTTPAPQYQPFPS